MEHKKALTDRPHDGVFTVNLSQARFPFQYSMKIFF